MSRRLRSALGWTAVTMFWVVLVVACAVTELKSFSACYETRDDRTGSVLHDVGFVVGWKEDPMTGQKIYHFRSSYWGRVIDVAEVNPRCPAINETLFGRSSPTRMKR